MSAVQPHLGVDRLAVSPGTPQAEPDREAPAPQRPDAAHYPEAAPFSAVPAGDSGHGLRLALSQQAELLALLAGSVHAGGSPASGPLAELRPVDTVRLADLQDEADAPGADPLAAFGVVAPQFASDADRVVEDLGGRGQAA